VKTSYRAILYLSQTNGFDHNLTTIFVSGPERSALLESVLKGNHIAWWHRFRGGPVIGEPVSHILVHLVEYVLISLEHGDLRPAKDLHNHSLIHTQEKHGGGRCVPAVVGSPYRNLCILEKRSPREPVRLRIDRQTALPAEDQIPLNPVLVNPRTPRRMLANGSLSL
jgi:hypothetical protein